MADSRSGVRAFAGTRDVAAQPVRHRLDRYGWTEDGSAWEDKVRTGAPLLLTAERLHTAEWEGD
ncbi:hypothetical protein OG285_37460 (plasmid) [Streptomyces sp. NBC_01471]|uniref:hypothetical protein n=1 Tax=Streptomyces sp. NBC_01471 TaxID=2903879 RepID=UPI0032452CFD